ncbi:MAG: hypothetical protein HOU01_22315 [Streptomycetaceae bacterium]|nr:hypothetical protein [Streptomycetaceae bacterium]
MTKFLLIVHVLAAIVAIGPVTVAASRFPPAARAALADPNEPAAVSAVRQLHRTCVVYGFLGVAVPVFGFGTASSMGVLGSAWLIVSIVLTALAAVLLVGLIVPGQAAIVGALTGSAAVDGTRPSGNGPVDRAVTARLAMATGLFNVLWAAVTVLMIVRPGSTTGA